ncbi:MAG TPA: hypothetical protein VKA70_07735 [Blastocatellia bacterium]|nr:hypothetical protein [Blastocatellia bacterium]
MKTFTRFLFVIVVLLLLATSDHASRDEARRIRFQIATVEERAGARYVISEAVVEGPPGTDFTVNLHDSRFKMDARFLTDLVTADRLKVRARLNTRRLYGMSERELPLYEEDSQNQAIDLGFDEGIVLLPFGRNGGDKLKIEITPAMSERPVFLASGEQAPLTIDILKQSPGGAVSIQASKIPHNFEVEAALTEDDREVARGAGVFLIEEAQELLLAPDSRASSRVADNPVAIKLLIDMYARTRPADQVGVSFDLAIVDARSGARREAIASSWAGIARLGGDMVYDISDYYLKSSGKRYKLRISIKPARGEILQ